jgi:hypothetical protein
VTLLVDAGSGPTHPTGPAGPGPGGPAGPSPSPSGPPKATYPDPPPQDPEPGPTRPTSTFPWPDPPGGPDPNPGPHPPPPKMHITDYGHRLELRTDAYELVATAALHAAGVWWFQADRRHPPVYVGGREAAETAIRELAVA